MPLSNGRFRRTRKLFRRPYRCHGLQNTTTFLHNYKIGDYVTVMCNSAVQHGLPFKSFHGKTGRVWNINPHAIGVMINKKVNNKILLKRFHVRPEHLMPSNCQKDFLARVKESEKIKIQNVQLKKEGKQTLALPKRMPVFPRGAEVLKKDTIKFTTINPIKFEELY
ncbi:60S ribosomal protein L21, putative [Entamoeba invadens IP1]|uniref:60S ribosomal protein L21, putative n=1 Tax=Entamoeba invadens IP1 TaxID=370355 RepID=L7FPM7_ENTIV|nr:60S ribosomal protein L21, putative [Entamoeba invadens IP1]ELP91600.1 60S ribosomal protein L21, putative [Entamoeba invadens IP1]|eukprot:XP_004258371.1 60S ribosomal protein L21, putative [Entamoeba invadens IP1]